MVCLSFDRTRLNQLPTQQFLYHRYIVIIITNNFDCACYTKNTVCIANVHEQKNSENKTKSSAQYWNTAQQCNQTSLMRSM